MLLEYWGKPEATRDKFIGDWLLTGDHECPRDIEFVETLPMTTTGKILRRELRQRPGAKG